MDDPVYGPNSYMKTSLNYEGLPIELEEQGGMWLGIGFGTSMLGADIVICQWNDTTGKTACHDRHASLNYTSTAPAIDAIDNIWTISGYKADNRLVLTFKRYLSTGDAADYVV